MVLHLDHVVIAVNDLEQAISDYETLGFTVLRGGVHGNQATHNALIVFSDGTYLELLAATGAPPLPDMIDFSRMLTSGEGLGGFALRTTDIEAEKRRLEAAGFAVGEIVPGAREKNGRVMRWKLALINDGFAPFLIEDVTPREWRVPGDAAAITHENQAVRLGMVEITVPKVVDSRAWCIQLLGLPPENYRFGREFECITLIQYKETTHAKLASLTGVRLIREAKPSDHFTLQRTHNVFFRQLTGVASTRDTSILHGLDDVDWAAVYHAYGPATDTPDHLRALTSKNPKVRSDADEALLFSVLHQGSIYPASIETIPFLIQLLVAPEVDNDTPLMLLDSFTFGGLATPSLKESTREKLQLIYPTLLQNLEHPDPIVRLTLIDHLALYPNDANRLIPLLQTQLQTESDPRVRATCLKALTSLWTGEYGDIPAITLTDEQQEFVSTLMLNQSTPLAMRFEAAQALIKLNPDRWLEDATKLFYHMMTVDRPILETLNSVDSISIIFSDVAEALKDHPDIAVQWVTAQTHHQDPEVRKWANYQLMDMLQNMQNMDQVIVPTLIEQLSDPDPDVREMALIAFNQPTHISAAQDKLRALAENDRVSSIRRIARNLLSRL